MLDRVILLPAEFFDLVAQASEDEVVTDIEETDFPIPRVFLKRGGPLIIVWVKSERLGDFPRGGL